MTMNFHRNRVENGDDSEQRAEQPPRPTSDPDPATKTPEATKTAEATKTPDAKPTPEVTKAPEAARPAEATKTAEETKAPEVTKTAEATKSAERATEQKSPGTGTTPATSLGTSSGTDPAAGRDIRTETRSDTPTVATGPSDDDLGRLNQRMERAIGDFVDDPRRAVREADAVLDEAAKRLTRLLEERRTSLRGTWHDDNGTKAGTEELRVALTRYRDMTRRLLDVA